MVAQSFGDSGLRHLALGLWVFRHTPWQECVAEQNHSPLARKWERKRGSARVSLSLPWHALSDVKNSHQNLLLKAPPPPNRTKLGASLSHMDLFRGWNGHLKSRHQQCSFGILFPLHYCILEDTKEGRMSYIELPYSRQEREVLLKGLWPKSDSSLCRKVILSQCFSLV